MKFISLETLAKKWTFAHTVAVAAWVLVGVLGLLLAVRHLDSSYPATAAARIYPAENATFTHPINWTLQPCVAGEPFLRLPGYLKTSYKGRQAYPLRIEADAAIECREGKPPRFALVGEPATQQCEEQGERLANGLLLRLNEQEDAVTDVQVRQACAPWPLLTFFFVDPKGEAGDQPEAKKASILGSRQYEDIRVLAESIRF